MAVIMVSCGQTELPENITYEKSTVTDCEGNEYVTVKIGDQWWMAENLRSTKYDTESAQAGKTIALSGTVVVFTPFRVQISATTTSIVGGVNYSINLTAEQRSKIGTLYNWAAALGLDNGQVDTVFVEKQQGICPNGWHIPADEEWTTLINYISTKGDGRYKTVTGWFDNNKPEENDAGFAALPAGFAQARNIKNLGFSANFVSSTNSDIRGSFCRSLTYKSEVVERYIEVKSYATSVRCVKND